MYLEWLQIANPMAGHCRWWLWDEPLTSSLSPWEHQTHNPPTPALTNSQSLTHNQILFNPNQPTDLGFSNIPVIRPW